MRKKASVRRTFYRSFCLLIVLPLVAVAAAGSALLYRKLLADAREMVQMRQEAVSSALTQDVRQASLQLAHFLLSEDSEGLALVDELPASSSRRYETAARLESIFDYYRLTGRRLEALHLYLTDGTSYQLYTGLAVYLVKEVGTPPYPHLPWPLSSLPVHIQRPPSRTSPAPISSLLPAFRDKAVFHGYDAAAAPVFFRHVLRDP